MGDPKWILFYWVSVTAAAGEYITQAISSIDFHILKITLGIYWYAYDIVFRAVWVYTSTSLQI